MMKDQKIEVKCTMDQKATIMAAAARDGTPVAVWMLALALKAARGE